MMLMAIDHVRDYVARSAMQFLPTDLTRTSAEIFFTRWITHFCAPVFMLTAGLGAFFWMSRGHRSKSELSRFLITRGIWLIFLEITVLRLVVFSQISFLDGPVILLILWAIGLSMIALAALIYLPIRLLATFSIAIIALHNLLDGIPAERFGRAAPLWDVLHQQDLFSFAGIKFVIAYPVLPWIGVMAGGYCLGTLFSRDTKSRNASWCVWGSRWPSPSWCCVRSTSTATRHAGVTNAPRYSPFFLSSTPPSTHLRWTFS